MTNPGKEKARVLLLEWVNRYQPNFTGFELAMLRNDIEASFMSYETEIERLEKVLEGLREFIK